MVKADEMASESYYKLYSTVPNISPYTIIKFLEGSKYQDGTKYIFLTSKYKFWPE